MNSTCVFVLLFCEL